MFVQIVCGGSLPMRMPEPQSGTQGDYLPMRGCLQVRPSLQLQAPVRAAIVPRIAPSNLIQLPDAAQYAGAAWSVAHAAVLAL